jgi:hypothetical protein
MSAFVPPLVEQAAVNFLEAQTFAQADEDGITLDAARILKGFQRTATVEQETKIPLPCAVCSCVNATISGGVFAGNWAAELLVELRSKVFDTSDTQHALMAEELLAFFFNTTIAAGLTSALSDFTAFLVVPQQQTRAIENNVWISRGRFLVLCCGSDIS